MICRTTALRLEFMRFPMRERYVLDAFETGTEVSSDMPYGERSAHFPVSLLQGHPDITIRTDRIWANLPE